MFSLLEHRFANLPPRRRGLTLWIVVGATLHLCLPALHSALTPAGPAGLWLWALPLAALGLDLMVEPTTGCAEPATVAMPPPRRRRGGAMRGPISRRDRARLASRAARSVRRAG